MTWTKMGSSILHLDGFGYVAVIHNADEDPRQIMRMYGETGIGLVFGPFQTLEAAKEAGTSALTELKKEFNRRGFKADRPAKA